MDADEIDWAWQEMHLHVRLRDSDGHAFETLFQDIGKALWGTAFHPTIPMGSRGDLKCDGWRPDVGHVYQCYGPRYGQANVPDALKKVDEDFRGAKDHWKKLLKKWWFVVGLYRDKVPSEVSRLMAELTNELSVPSDILHRGDIVTLARDIEAGAARGAQLTSQLLAFARRQKLRPERRSVNELVREFDVLANRMLGEAIGVEFALDPVAGVCQVDPAQFGSALLNLVVNARDAMAAGGRLAISTFTRSLAPREAAQHADARPGEYVVVEVMDTGSGMPPDVIEREANGQQNGHQTVAQRAQSAAHEDAPNDLC